MSHDALVSAMARVSGRECMSDSALWYDSVARTVQVGQHLFTSYPVVTVALVIDAAQECGQHSADYAETLGRMCLLIQQNLSVLARVMFER